MDWSFKNLAIFKEVLKKSYLSGLVKIEEDATDGLDI